MPDWNHLHPAVVHFPIALLAVAPLLVLLGLAWPSQRRGVHGAALVLLVLGVAGAVLSILTGQAAELFARRTPELRAAVGQHEDLAKGASFAFALLTAAFAGLWSLPLLRRREPPPRLILALTITWLLLSAAAVLVLTRAGHLGGHMVHDLHTHGGP